MLSWIIFGMLIVNFTILFSYNFPQIKIVMRIKKADELCLFTLIFFLGSSLFSVIASVFQLVALYQPNSQHSWYYVYPFLIAGCANCFPISFLIFLKLKYDHINKKKSTFKLFSKKQNIKNLCYLIVVLVYVAFIIAVHFTTNLSTIEFIIFIFNLGNYVCLIIFQIPQVWMVYKNKKADELSMLSYVLLYTVQLLFSIVFLLNLTLNYPWYVNIPAGIAGILNVFCYLAIIIMKIKYDKIDFKQQVL